LLLKDNENIPLPISSIEDLDSAPDPKPFALDQMVPCEECLRANPPTRINCMYCGAVLPHSESGVDLQKPTLRPLEKWELGYNNILVPDPANVAALAESDLELVAEMLKRPSEDLSRLLSMNATLPVSRAATIDEASLIQRRLRDFGIETQILSDGDLGVSETGPSRVRAFEMTGDTLRLTNNIDTESTSIAWQELELIVTGRLVSTRIELSEEKGKQAENRILDASQFFSDEVVFDLYATDYRGPFRIAANSFDFSSLAERKGLVSVGNMKTLLDIFQTRAPQIEVDQSYHALRKVIELVWPLEQQVESGGWRRARPGKYSVGSVTVKDNEAQFYRYSLLRYHVYSKSGKA